LASLLIERETGSWDQFAMGGGIEGGKLGSPRLGPHELRTWKCVCGELLGVPDYGYSVDQLDYYLDEFTFRFNRRSAHSRGLLFYRLLQQAVATVPDPYRELTTAASVDHWLWP